MNNLGGTLIILVVALVLLWLAVTDRLSRVLDAWDVLRGNATSTQTTSNTTNTATISLPSLPKIGTNVQVTI